MPPHALNFHSQFIVISILVHFHPLKNNSPIEWGLKLSKLKKNYHKSITKVVHMTTLKEFVHPMKILS